MLWPMVMAGVADSVEGVATSFEGVFFFSLWMAIHVFFFWLFASQYQAVLQFSLKRKHVLRALFPQMLDLRVPYVLQPTVRACKCDHVGNHSCCLLFRFCLDSDQIHEVHLVDNFHILIAKDDYFRTFYLDMFLNGLTPPSRTTNITVPYQKRCDIHDTVVHPPYNPNVTVLGGRAVTASLPFLLSSFSLFRGHPDNLLVRIVPLARIHWSLKRGTYVK